MAKAIPIDTLSRKRQELSDEEFLKYLETQWLIKKSPVENPSNKTGYLHCQCTEQERTSCSLCPNGVEWYSTIT